MKRWESVSLLDILACRHWLSRVLLVLCKGLAIALLNILFTNFKLDTGVNYKRMIVWYKDNKKYGHIVPRPWRDAVRKVLYNCTYLGWVCGVPVYRDQSNELLPNVLRILGTMTSIRANPNTALLKTLSHRISGARAATANVNLCLVVFLTMGAKSRYSLLRISINPYAFLLPSEPLPLRRVTRFMGAKPSSVRRECTVRATRQFNLFRNVFPCPGTGLLQ
jgi:hypothetical protein